MVLFEICLRGLKDLTLLQHHTTIYIYIFVLPQFDRRKPLSKTALITTKHINSLSKVKVANYFILFFFHSIFKVQVFAKVIDSVI